MDLPFDSTLRPFWHRVVLIALCILFPAVLLAERRSWTNREGRVIDAEFRALEGDTVQMVLPNGRLAEVPMSNLSDADQEWVREKVKMESGTPDPEGKPVSPPPVVPEPKGVGVKWAGLMDLGLGLPELAPLPEPDPNAPIAVDDWIGGRFFYMRPDGTDAFPQFEIKNRVKPFSDGLAWIKTEGAEGYIDREGKWVIGGDSGVPLPEGAGSFEPFSEGLARFMVGRYSGYMDKVGAVVIPAVLFVGAGDFSGGFAAVNDSADLGEPTWRYIDRTGKVVIAGPWFGARPFRDGVAWVSLDKGGGGPYSGRYQLIDGAGKPVLGDATYKGHQTEARFSGGYCRIDGSVYEADGSVFLEEAEDFYLTSFSDDSPLAMASLRGAGGFRLVHLPTISVYGPVISGSPGHPFQEGMAAVSMREGKNRFVCIDRSGRVVIDTGFFDAPQFRDGFAVVRRAFGEDESDIRVVVIDRTGKIVWKGEGRPQ